MNSSSGLRGAGPSPFRGGMTVRIPFAAAEDVVVGRVEGRQTSVRPWQNRKKPPSHFSAFALILRQVWRGGTPGSCAGEGLMASSASVDSARVTLLGDFTASCHDHVLSLPLGAKRLVALLALEQRHLRRTVAAEILWPRVTRELALTHLRGAIWHAREVHPTLLTIDRHQIGLNTATVTDLEGNVALARRILDDARWAPHEALQQVLRASLNREVLPGFGEDWVLLHRVRFDQLRLHALEALAQRLTEQQLLPQAIDIALWATHLDPLRESPQRILLRAYAEEGNYSDALRQYARFRDLLAHELGVQPSRQLQELVESLGHRP